MWRSIVRILIAESKDNSQITSDRQYLTTIAFGSLQNAEEDVVDIWCTRRVATLMHHKAESRSGKICRRYSGAPSMML